MTKQEALTKWRAARLRLQRIHWGEDCSEKEYDEAVARFEEAQQRLRDVSTSDAQG